MNFAFIVFLVEFTDTSRHVKKSLPNVNTLLKTLIYSMYQKQFQKQSIDMSQAVLSKQRD